MSTLAVAKYNNIIIITTIIIIIDNKNNNNNKNNKKVLLQDLTAFPGEYEASINKYCAQCCSWQCMQEHLDDKYRWFDEVVPNANVARRVSQVDVPGCNSWQIWNV